MVGRDRADGGHLGLGQPRAGRVVRIADGNQPGPIADQRPQLVEVRRPARGGAGALLPQAPGSDDGAEAFRQAGHLAVVRLHHHHFVARLDEAPAGDEVGLGAAAGDEHLAVGRAGQGGGDGRAQRRRAVGLGVGKRLIEQGVSAVRTDEVADAKRLHAALRQVDLDLMLVERLVAFELERGDSHGEALHRPASPAATSPGPRVPAPGPFG